MKDIFGLAKDREEKLRKERVEGNQKLAKEIFDQLKEKNLQVADAMLVVQGLQNIIQNLSGKKIQEMYLNHL